MDNGDSNDQGRVNQPNPYGYDEYEAGLSQHPDTTPDTQTPLEFPVEVDIAGWCRHLGLGETLAEQRDALVDLCPSLSLHLARRILEYSKIPDQETLTDIAQHFGLTERELLEGPPESEDDSWGIAARGEGVTAEEVRLRAARIQAMRQHRPPSGDHPRPYGYEGDC